MKYTKNELKECNSCLRGFDSSAPSLNQNLVLKNKYIIDKVIEL